jgi:hypothetical protein
VRHLNFEPHAVERFIERHAPGLSMPEAHRRLRDAVASASIMRERTRSGDECWMLGDLDVVAVIKRDGRDGKRASCVTVLPKGGHREYVHERRVSMPTPPNPADAALRVAARYAIASAGRGCERARRVVQELSHLVPWIVSVEACADAENEGAPGRDGSDGGTLPGVARLGHEMTNGGVR